MASPDRPVVLAILPGLIPSTVISVVKPFLALHRAGLLTAKFALERFVTTGAIAQADVVVFCRNTEPRHAGALEAVRALGKPYIYDLDDNFFEVPLTVEEGRYHRDPARLALLTRYLAGANRVRVYSQALRRRVEPINPRLEVVAGSLDWELVSQNLAARRPGKVKIVYVTSRMEDELAGLFLEPVRRLFDGRPGQVEVTFWGYHPPEMRGRPEVKFLNPEPDYDRFLKRLAASGFDIGLAPLLDDEFHRSKTNNKFREYGACRIAGIYSNVEVYASCVARGETGLLVANEPQAWLEALLKLVDDVPWRQRIQAQAQAYVRAHYSQDLTGEVWLRQIKSVLAEGGAQPDLTEPPGETSGGRSIAARLLAAASSAGVMGARLARRARTIGLKPTLLGVYRSLYNLKLLLQINRQLSAPGAPPDRRGQ